MTFAIAAAEFRYQIRSLQAVVTFGAFFGLNFLFTANGEEFKDVVAGGTVLANAPYSIINTLILMSIVSVFTVPAFVANAVLRDIDHRFDAILFATPIREADYLAGRFAGAFLALMVTLSGAPLGMLLGTFWPWADTELLGPTHLGHYASTFFGILVPTMLAISAIVFAVAVISRSLISTYITTLVLLAFYLVTGELNVFPPVLDPFLFEVFDAETRYWTAAERNTQFLGFGGDILWSRLLWIGVAGLLFLLANRWFSFRRHARKKAKAEPTPEIAEAASVDARDMPRATDTPTNADDRGTPAWGWQTRIRQFSTRTLFEIKAVTSTFPFIFLMLLSCLLLVVKLTDREVMYGVDAHPVTRLMLADSSFLILAVMIVLAFYSADVIWRERAHGIHEIVDALPTSNGLFVASKLTALVFIVAGILGLGILIGVTLQLLAGYDAIDWGLYLERGLAFPLLQLVCLAVLTCFLQVVARGRYLGMMLFGLCLAALVISRDVLELEHPLTSFVFPGVAAPLSDMNGTGRFMVFGYWMRAYWGLIASLLLVFTFLLYQRGTMQPLRYQLRRVRAESAGAVPLVAALAIGLLGTASFIYFNTNVLNDYHSRDDVKALRAAYEKKFRHFEDLPMPRIVDVRMDVDLYPGERRAEARSIHVLENETDVDLPTVHVVFPPGLEVARVTLEGATLSSLDETLVPYYVFDATQPIAPGEQRRLEFEVRIENRGFPHRSPDTRLVGNGIFLNNSHLAPSIGFEPDYLLEDPDARKAHGLPPLPRRPALEDVSQHHNNVSRQDSDFLTFETTISTTAAQTAVSLGTLEKEWTEGDRRFFHYTMATPVRNFYPFLSAEYVVARDQWRDVEIEVLYHAPHTYNVERMIAAMKDSLDFYSEAFGPYPFRQVRIVEFPAFKSYAQAYAGTIPFSEAMGFVADVKPGDIDMPYYVTAHEMAHMWWGHIVTAANTQGDGFIHETLAQYSALRVMEKHFGHDKIRRFLKYELDRYLAGRADDPEGELPLHRVEQQQYVHYRKGSLVMYAAADYLGADTVDRSLRRLVELRGFSSAPYTISTDFLDILREEADPAQHPLIEDLFERITLYDLEMVDGEVRELDDGRFEVLMDVEAAKFYAAADGTETATAFDLPVDIGLFRRSPAAVDFSTEDVIAFERRQVADGRSTMTLIVDSRPQVVGIDPYNKLIDRDSDDNLLALR